MSATVIGSGNRYLQVSMHSSIRKLHFPVGCPLYLLPSAVLSLWCCNQNRFDVWWCRHWSLLVLAIKKKENWKKNLNKKRCASCNTRANQVANGRTSGKPLAPLTTHDTPVTINQRCGFCTPYLATFSVWESDGFGFDLLAGLVLLCLSYLSRFAQTKFMPVNGGRNSIGEAFWAEDGGGFSTQCDLFHCHRLRCVFGIYLIAN